MYDYKEAVLEDVREYIKDEVNLEDWKDNRDGLEQFLNDELFINDSVTGNASGSYTFSSYEAEENLCHNWDLLADALEEFGSDTDILRKGPEACDVTIRCYLLGHAIAEALDELDEEGAFDEEEEEEN